MTTKWPNSMTYWWPRVMNVDVPKPMTAMVNIEPKEWAAIRAHVEGDMDALEKEGVPVRKIFNGAMQRVYHQSLSFERPMFVRGDELSDKHDWKNTCFVNTRNKREFIGHLMAIAETHMMNFWLTGEPLQAFALRELIKTKTLFTAFHGDLPITKERRIFWSNDGGVVCNHFYWPKGAIEQGYNHQLPFDWRRKLAGSAKLGKYEKMEVEFLAACVGMELASEEFPNWSIDFLKGADGKWYFIDCAVAERSYHWEGCRVPVERGWKEPEIKVGGKKKAPELFTVEDDEERLE